MKTKLWITAGLTGLVTLMVAVSGRDYVARMRERGEDVTSDYQTIVTSWGIGTALASLFVLFGLPWLWAGFLRCTRDFSKSIRDR